MSKKRQLTNVSFAEALPYLVSEDKCKHLLQTIGQNGRVSCYKGEQHVEEILMGASKEGYAIQTRTRAKQKRRREGDGYSVSGATDEASDDEVFFSLLSPEYLHEDVHEDEEEEEDEAVVIVAAEATAEADNVHCKRVSKEQVADIAIADEQAEEGREASR